MATLHSTGTRSPLDPAMSVPLDAETATSIFGSLTFTGDVMLKRLPDDVFRKLQQTMKQGARLDPAIANTVALAMKDWAVEHGCTHYCHWFQPLTGSAVTLSVITGGGAVSGASSGDSCILSCAAESPTAWSDAP